jgi:hypothetical protein
MFEIVKTRRIRLGLVFLYLFSLSISLSLFPYLSCPLPPADQTSGWFFDGAPYCLVEVESVLISMVSQSKRLEGSEWRELHKTSFHYPSSRIYMSYIYHVSFSL